MHRTATETREHVLEVAQDLFYWHGVRAIGVDRVAADAGVAPTTLYRLFRSKDELVAAYVRCAAEQFQQWFNLAVESAGPEPAAPIYAVFDELAVQVQPDRCRGCTFLMTLAEFPEATLPAHQDAVTVKRWVLDRFGELAQALPVDDPAALAAQLALVFEGVNASVQALGADGPARQARTLAEMIVMRATAGDRADMPAVN